AGASRVHRGGSFADVAAAVAPLRWPHWGPFPNFAMNKVRVFSCAVVIGAVLACALALARTSGGGSAASDALASYVARPDKSLEWHEVDSGKVGTADY